MADIEVGIIGTGWCGGIRAEACAAYPGVRALHIAETRPERLAEMTALTRPASASADYRELLANPDIAAVFVCATPETLHYPIARESLLAGKHVFLEKPIAIELWEADELIALARKRGLKFTIGYSQRFNPKYAYLKQSIDNGSLGKPISALVSRHLSRSLGNKITGRGKLSPAAMESTHDLDFILWCLEPAKPVRVYSQSVLRVRNQTQPGTPDIQWTLVTMDDGTTVTVGGAWIMPPGHPNFSHTWIEFLGSEGSLVIDDTHRDVTLNTMQRGATFPMSTMPGEPVGHVFAGPMATETLHFVDAVLRDKPPLVTPEQARRVMEVYTAADLSAELNEPISLPLQGARPAASAG